MMEALATRGRSARKLRSRTFSVERTSPMFLGSESFIGPLESRMLLSVAPNPVIYYVDTSGATQQATNDQTINSYAHVPLHVDAVEKAFQLVNPSQLESSTNPFYDPVTGIYDNY